MVDSVRLRLPFASGWFGLGRGQLRPGCVGGLRIYIDEGGDGGVEGVVDADSYGGPDTR